MNGFFYTLTLDEPVLANSLGGEPNSARSLFYIPGGLIRGAAIEAYQGKKDAGDEKEGAFRSLFINGETRFLNAYPLFNGERSLPIPLKYKKPKYLDAGNLGKFGDTKIDALEEEWQINVHTQRDAQKGRSTEKSGAVYRYIALPAGMKFRGAVISKNAGAIKEILDQTKTILLGKARTAGYGRASITTESTTATLYEMSKVPQTDLKDFTLILLSPTLVRNEDGQFTLDISTALSARLGREIKPDQIRASCKPEIVGGFNRTWGLPLPQSTAIAAGSVFRVTLESEVTAKNLEELENTGIGERRAEGFGAVAVAASLPEIEDKKENWNKISEKNQPDYKNEFKLTAEDNQLADMMLTRILRRELDELIVTKAREMIVDYKKDGVPNSQLSRWRVIVRDSLAKRGTTIEEKGEKKEFDPIQRMKDFYHAENKKRSSAWVKMEKARIKFAGSPHRLAEWIETALENPKAVDQVLESASTLQKAIGSNPIQLSDKLKIEYRLRLMDAILSMMTKTNSGKGGKNG